MPTPFGLCPTWAPALFPKSDHTWGLLRGRNGHPALGFEREDGESVEAAPGGLGPWPFLLPESSSLPPPVPRDWPGARGSRLSQTQGSGPGEERGGVDALLAIGPPPSARTDTTERRALEGTSRVRRGRPPVSGYVTP